MTPVVPDWPRAHGTVPGRGLLRSRPEDFRVDEDLGLSPDGAGEHLLVQVRKTGANTAWVAGWLARAAGLKERDIGYAGLKDRHAVTSQWFSLPLGNRAEPDWPGHPDIEILQTVRHGRKLRRGTLAGNRFVITLREVTAKPEALAARAESIRTRGVPDYFGPQRFGRGAANLGHAAAMFAGRRVRRHQRGLYLSAARSLLFNRVLAARVEQGSWDRLLPGEAVMLAGSRSFFIADTIEPELQQRLQAGDIHPSGPLWGRGELPSRDTAAALEHSVLEAEEAFRHGLELAGLRQERRALRLPVPDFRLEVTAPATVQCHFTLPAGSFATSVLRELIDYEDATRAADHQA